VSQPEPEPSPEPAEPPGDDGEQGRQALAAAEEWGAGDWEREVETPPPPWPSPTAAYLLVLGLGAIGLALLGAVGQDWVPAELFRLGAVLVAVAVLAATLLRAVLPDDRAGPLVLRSRRVDVALYAALGTAAIVLAVVVPSPTG
jgi:hypothetical protein